MDASPQGKDREREGLYCWLNRLALTWSYLLPPLIPPAIWAHHDPHHHTFSLSTEKPTMNTMACPHRRDRDRSGRAKVDTELPGYLRKSRIGPNRLQGQPASRAGLCLSIHPHRLALPSLTLLVWMIPFTVQPSWCGPARSCPVMGCGGEGRGGTSSQGFGGSMASANSVLCEWEV